MSWNQLTLDVPDDLKDAVVGELFDEGVAGVWENGSQLILYFGPRANLPQIERRVRAIFERSGCGNPAISQSVVEDCDWTGEWKKSYTSFPIGDDFFVIPSWDQSKHPHDRLPIRIDPGQAFGTGTHETTQLMVEALERWIEPGDVVLDVGTGSGILAIASRLLGAKYVFACDIDPVAVQVARANIQRNSGNDVWAFTGSIDAVHRDSVRLVMGNLTADLIKALFADFGRILRPHGIAILSGILQEQREDICEVIAGRGFTVHEELTRGEWLALIAEKHVA